MSERESHRRWPIPPLLAFTLMVVIVATGLLLAGYGRADRDLGEGDTLTKVKRFVQAEMDASGIPGISLAIVDNGRVEAQGFGEDGTGQFITPQTPFWIGSNTKSFTALAVMQLVEAGKIELDAPVQRYLPDFAVADAAASSRITLRHLLNQTSGFSRADGIAPVLEERQQTLEDAVADMRSVRLNRPVGESFEYSNLNFVVLGLMVQCVSGQPWGDYVQRQIFGPLAMRNSFTSLDEAKAHGLTESHGYWFGLPVATEGVYLESLAPTGWIFSTGEDMAHYLSMYLDGGTYNGVRLLSEQGIATMLAPATNTTERQLQSHRFTFEYGEGWFVGPFGAAEDARWHLGNLPYFTSWMVLLPESDQAVMVMINAGSQFEIAGANAVMSRIPIGVVNILRGEDPPIGNSIRQFFIVFDAAVLILLATQAWSLWRVLSSSAALPGSLRGYIFALAPLSWEFGVSAVILVGFPASLGATWSQSFRQIPDLTLVLLAVCALWLLTGATRLTKLFLAASRERPRGLSTHSGPAAHSA